LLEGRTVAGLLDQRQTGAGHVLGQEATFVLSNDPVVPPMDDQSVGPDLRQQGDCRVVADQRLELTDERRSRRLPLAALQPGAELVPARYFS
jgi:hypothetical protein